jgi:hypothetical protein
MITPLPLPHENPKDVKQAYMNSEEVWINSMAGRQRKEHCDQGNVTLRAARGGEGRQLDLGILTGYPNTTLEIQVQ